MKQYELTFLVHPDLEMNLDTVVSKVKELISANGGKVTKETNEGKKKLAYTIKGQDFAVYYYMELDLPAEAPAKISSTLNIVDEVLRYLLVTVDERKLKLEAKKEERQTDQADEAQDDKTEEE
ncbi:30S ribosomal protein S6 [Candidatus Saccharibacteria bacterium]|nr:30S ribosomal protein S6 [Candidatus Saccharibacteria bacterium]